MGLRPCKKIVANWLKDKEFETILELGCQWSENLIAIKELFPNAKLTGIDVDAKTIEESFFTTSGMNIEIGDARKVRFPDKSFDVVFVEALLCMNQPHDNELIVKEIKRLAKKFIILVELGRTGGGYDTLGGRTRCDIEDIFKEYKVEKRKITKEEWGVNPWLLNGYLYTICI